MDSSSSCGPQPNAHPPPPIAQAPMPMGVICRSLEPSFLVCIKNDFHEPPHSQPRPADDTILPVAPRDNAESSTLRNTSATHRDKRASACHPVDPCPPDERSK